MKPPLSEPEEANSPADPVAKLMHLCTIKSARGKKKMVMSVYEKKCEQSICELDLQIEILAGSNDPKLRSLYHRKMAF